MPAEGSSSSNPPAANGRPASRRSGRPPGGDEPGGTRNALLEAAILEFARHGFAGASISQICAAAGINVRMVYHYFGSKDGLYIAALESVMADLRAEELKLDVDQTAPLVGLLQLFDFIHDHFEANPQLVSILSTENLLQAQYLRQSERIPAMSSPVPKMIADLVGRGVAEGTVRDTVDPLRLYVMMVALSYFHLSNVHTLSAIFADDLSRDDWRMAQRRDAHEMIERFLRTE